MIILMWFILFMMLKLRRLMNICFIIYVKMVVCGLVLFISVVLILCKRGFCLRFGMFMFFSF